LGEKSGTIALVLPGLMAGWLAGWQMKYRIARNFRKPKFLKNSFQWVFRKNIFEIFGYLILLCYRLVKL